MRAHTELVVDLYRCGCAQQDNPTWISAQKLLKTERQEAFEFLRRTDGLVSDEPKLTANMLRVLQALTEGRKCPPGVLQELRRTLI